MSGENPSGDEPGWPSDRYPDRYSDRRAYEAAVLAALDFQPELGAAFEADPERVVRNGRRRARRPALRLAALAVLHVVVAVVFAELLAGGVGGAPLALAAAAWLTATALIARTIFHAGTRPRRRAL